MYLKLHISLKKKMMQAHYFDKLKSLSVMEIKLDKKRNKFNSDNALQLTDNKIIYKYDYFNKIGKSISYRN